MNDNAALRLLYLGLPPIGEQEPTALPFSPEALAASPLALTATDLATIPALFAAAWTERDDGGNRADTPDASACAEAGAEADAIAAAFAAIPVNRTPKVRVGVVGEIYMKYSRLGNSNLQGLLEDEGCAP